MSLSMISFDGCISYFYAIVIKILDKNGLREGRFVWPTVSVHHNGESMAGGAAQFPEVGACGVDSSHRGGQGSRYCDGNLHVSNILMGPLLVTDFP